MSTMRTTNSYTHGTVTAVVTLNTDLAEYRVRLIVNGKPQPDADYFTDDSDDAIGTAKMMVATAVAK